MILRHERHGLRPEYLVPVYGAVAELHLELAADDRGRGLFLVATLAADWGVAPAHDGGKAVWFLLQRPVG